MPMIDVYAATGTVPDTAQLAQDLATAVMTVEGVPNCPRQRSRMWTATVRTSACRS
jgi:hypothetical protein